MSASVKLRTRSSGFKHEVKREMKCEVKRECKREVKGEMKRLVRWEPLDQFGEALDLCGSECKRVGSVW